VLEVTDYLKLDYEMAGLR